MSRFVCVVVICLFSNVAFAKTVGLSQRSSLFSLVASDPAAADFIKELEDFIDQHAAEFNSYVETLKVDRSTQINPDFTEAIMKIRRHHRTLLAKSPMGRMLLAHTAHQMNLERLLKLQTLTALAKAKGDSPELRRQLGRIELAIEHTLIQLDKMDAQLEHHICAILLSPSKT